MKESMCMKTSDQGLIYKTDDIFLKAIRKTPATFFFN